jgi:sugar O-acyltransferase (sialic acid O-acetyltransferase NeuD family)
MTEPIDLVILGAGGHGRQLLDLVNAQNEVAAQPYRFLGFLDDGPIDEDLVARQGARLLGPTAMLSDLDAAFAIGISSPEHRRRLDAAAAAAGRTAVSLQHPTAVVGSLVVAEPGLFLSAGTVVDTNVRVGRHFQLNWHASVGHDCLVGDYVTVAPGVRVSGSCTIGSDVFIGTNAAVIQGVTIGDGAVVGAGAVVRGDLPSGITYTGGAQRGS